MNVLKRLKIGQRLIAAFLIVAAIGGVIGGFGITSLSRINELNDRLYDRELLGISYVKEANLNLIMAERARMRLEQASTAQARDEHKRAVQAAIKEMLVWADKARPLFVAGRGPELFREFDTQAAAWIKNIELYLPMIEAHPLGTARTPALEAMNATLGTANRSVDDLMTRLSEYKEAQGAAAAQEVTDTFEQMRLLLLGLSVLGVALSVLLGVAITRGIIKPLRSAIEVSKRVAAGDLTGRIEVTTQDETGELMTALQEMNASLAHIVGDVRAGSESIASASAQIAQGNTDLSQRTEEQASSLEETAASMEELTSTVQQNANNAFEADKLVAQASQIASHGSTTVGHVVGTMTSIAESSRRISEITGVIDGIAFQTNILALNAAVEAARAGEQGRGFAVVAGEVRNLAQRSATAAREIKSLIEESVSRVQSGNQQAADAGRVMEDVLGSVQRVATLVKEIASASTEQSSGIGQVNQAVSQMDSVTQQNAALVEEAAAAATSLQEQAGQLASRVRHFKVDSDVHHEAHALRTPSRMQTPRAPALRQPVRSVSTPRPKPAIAAPLSPATSAAPRSQPAAKASATDDWESF